MEWIGLDWIELDKRKRVDKWILNVSPFHSQFILISVAYLMDKTLCCAFTVDSTHAESLFSFFSMYDRLYRLAEPKLAELFASC